MAIVRRPRSPTGALHQYQHARAIGEHNWNQHQEAQEVRKPVEHDRLDAEHLDAVAIDDGVSCNQRSGGGIPAHTVLALRPAERRQITLCCDEGYSGHHSQEPHQAVCRRGFAENNKGSQG